MAESGDEFSDRPSVASPPPLIVRASHVAEHRVTAMDNPLNFRFEVIRLASFATWLNAAVTPAALAAAGFYYTGERDLVRCFACHTELEGWSTGDIPEEEHRNWTTRCPILQGTYIGNVPIGGPDRGPVRRTRDEAGIYRTPHAAPPPYYGEVSYLSTLGNRLNGPNMHRLRSPVYPSYIGSDARFRSFSEWPRSMYPRGCQLAEAGFFYRGESDKVTCYHCGGGLRNWEPADEPWEQHAKWFPTCAYLWVIKGQDFINQMLERPPLPPSAEELRNLALLNCQVHTPALKEEAHYTGNEVAAGSTARSLTGQPTAPVPSTQAKPPAEAPSPPEETAGASANTAPPAPLAEPADKGDYGLCKICFEDKIEIVFIPCGHVACGKCVLNLTQCAVCRADIILIMRMYL